MPLSPYDGNVGLAEALNSWSEKLEQMRQLKDGWNRHHAPAPSDLAISNAAMLLEVMAQEETMPTRLAPSAIGGVGVTRRRGGRMAYTEFYNNGTAHALLTDEENDSTFSVQTNRKGLEELLAKIKAYLDG